MFVAAVSGAGLAALDSAIEGYMYVFGRLVFVIGYLLQATQDRCTKQAA